MKTDSYENHGIRGVNIHGQAEQRVHCPKCPERMPYKHANSRFDKDLSVNIDKETWLCHRCGWTGGLSRKREYKVDFIPKEVERRYKTKAESELEKVYSFFAKRQISRATLEAHKIEYVSVPGGAGETGAIAFPFYVGDVCVNIKYRTHDKKFLQTKGGQRVFYGLNNITEENTAVIVEGEIDALSFYEAGIRNVISVPDGAINPNAESVNAKLEFIDNSYEYIQHIETFYLALDNDPPGIRMREELARRLGKSNCYIVEFPDGYKDANELLIGEGKTALHNVLSEAEPYPIEGYRSALSALDNLKEIYHNGYPTGYKSGWEVFDERLKFFVPSVCIVTGLPAHGKSNWLDELILRLALNNGCKFGVFSSENGSLETHLHRLTEILIGKPLLKEFNSRMSEEEMLSAVDFINKHLFFIEPKYGKNTIDNILGIVSELVKRYGINGLVLDPWNTIEHDFGYDNETKYTEKILNRLTAFAREKGLILFIVAHPTKMPKNKKTDKYEVPTLYDISGSSNWYNKAEVGIAVYREFSADFERTEYTAVYVQKVKHKHWGRTGYIKFHFDPPSQRFKQEKDLNCPNRSYLEPGGLYYLPKDVAPQSFLSATTEESSAVEVEESYENSPF